MPTHLSVFALDSKTGSPLPGMPVYAEVGVAAAVIGRAVPLDAVLEAALLDAVESADKPFAEDPQSVDRLRSALAEALGRVLTPEGRARLIQDAPPGEVLRELIVRAQKETGLETLVGLDQAQLTRAAQDAVRAYAQAHELPTVSEQDESTVWAYPLGVVATDHVGYLSFDLTRLPEEVRFILAQSLEARTVDPNAPVPVTVWLYSRALDAARIDGLRQARFARDAVVVKLELSSPDPDMASMPMRTGLSMQNPSLIDWRLSGGSFASNPRTLLGEGGCEDLFPANVALHQFNLYQVVRLTDLDLVPQPLQDRIRVGVVHEYRLSWVPLGHSLGEILYSAPLAPGESMNLAVVDWSRRDETKRAEDTKLDEQLVHNERRDRTITETVQASLHEYQHGSSFLAGAALSVGGAYSAGAYGLAAGLAGSLGGSTSSTDGSRQLAADTVQKVSDNISQASTAMRELQSTVVVQASQAEKEVIETRAIANYNHSHTLTVLYYEVLRHFRIVTELVARRPAVFVRARADWFSGADADRNILENRGAIESALLEPRFTEGLNALERVAHHEAVTRTTPPPPAAVDQADREFAFFTFHFQTALALNDDAKSLFIGAHLIGVPSGGQNVQLRNADGNPDILASHGSFREADRVTTFTARPPDGVSAVKWRDIASVYIHFQLQGDILATFARIWLEARDAGGNTETLADENYRAAGGDLHITDNVGIVLPARRPAAPMPPPQQSPEATEDQAKRIDLLEHIQYHSAHYSRSIVLNVEKEERARQLDAVIFPDGSTALDKIENRPLEVLGDFVAYPCSDSTWIGAITKKLAETDKLAESKAVSMLLEERLVTLPTRGVFAEAKLGRCNSSEEIDNTRFWDWQTSPIPRMASEIAPATPVTPKSEQLPATPTVFPSPIVNIVNPPAAPDPTGLAGALTLLGTSDIFRDMSGRQEVAGLLKTLSDNSVKIAEAAKGKGGGTATTQTEEGSSTTAGRGNTVSSTPPSPPKASPSAPGDAADGERAQIDTEKARLEVAKDLPPAQQAEVRATTTKKLTSSPGGSKTKTFVFKAKDYQGMDIEYAVHVTVLDNSDSDAAGAPKQVFDGSFKQYGSTQVTFKRADPVIDVHISVDSFNADFGLIKFSVPKINMTTGRSLSVPVTQSLVQVLLQQDKRHVELEEETMEKAATELADKFGGELGFDKVIAAKILGEHATRTQEEKSGKQVVKYSVDLPGGAFTLTVI